MRIFCLLNYLNGPMPEWLQDVCICFCVSEIYLSELQYDYDDLTQFINCMMHKASQLLLWRVLLRLACFFMCIIIKEDKSSLAIYCSSGTQCKKVNDFKYLGCCVGG